MIHSFLLACHVVADQFTMIFREHDLIEYICTKIFDVNFYSITTKIYFAHFSSRIFTIICKYWTSAWLNLIFWGVAMSLVKNKIPYAPHYNPRFAYFLPTFRRQFLFSRRFFRKILSLCMVNIQERFLIKSGLWWRAYGIQN